MYNQGYIPPQNQGRRRRSNPQPYGQPQQPQQAQPAQQPYQPYQAYQQPQPNWYAPGPQQSPAQPQPQRASGGNGGGKSSGGKKKPAWQWQLVKVLLVIGIVAFLGIKGYNSKIENEVKPYLNVFLPNVYVDGICLEGMTWEEGSQAVWNQANTKKNGWYIRLKNQAGEYKDITADMLGINFDPSAALTEAWAIGHSVDKNNPKDKFQLQEELEAAKTNTYNFSSAQQSADVAPIDTILTTLQTAAYRAPKNAVMLSFNPDDMYEPFTYQQEVYGQYLDTTAVKEEIYSMVNTFTSGEIMLELTPIPPEITVADLQKKVELRYRAVTPISSDSTPERTANVEVAFSKINGLILADGKKFSFNKIVGRRNEKNGFFQAIEYAYGQEVLGWGGGVCQASTTVYLAAIQAGLKINHREAHSNPVSYTQMGMDATVSDTRGREIDFTFTNNTGGDIYIAAHVVPASTNSRSLLCEVRIYGPSLGDTSYMLESQIVETLPKPVDPILTPDETSTYVFYVDETKRYSKGRDGYVVDTYLLTMVNGEEVERTHLHQDTYPERADRYWVGINPR